MKSLWNEQEAAERAANPLALRVYTSRLLGREPDAEFVGGVATDDQYHADAEIEGAAHVLFGHRAELLNQREQGRARPRVPGDIERQVLRDDAPGVAHDAAAGDVRERVHQAGGARRGRPPKSEEHLPPELKAMQESLSMDLGAPVEIHKGMSNNGKITITFYSEEELENIMRRLGKES